MQSKAKGRSKLFEQESSQSCQDHICLAFEALNLPLCLTLSLFFLCHHLPSFSSALFFPRAYEKVLEEVDKCKAVLSACEQRDVKARQVSHAPNTSGGFVGTAVSQTIV